jgi:hypothetical protein
MSIEKLIETHTDALLENTFALRELTKAWLGLAKNAQMHNAAGTMPQTIAGAQISKSEPVKAADTPKTAAQAEETLFDFASKEKAEPAKKPTDVAVEYGAVRELLLATAKTNRDGVTALLKAQGLKNLKVLLDDENDFASVNAPAKLAAIYEALKAMGE